MGTCGGVVGCSAPPPFQPLPFFSLETWVCSWAWESPKCSKTSLGLGGEQRPQAYKGSDSDCWLQFLTEPEKPLFLLKTFHARLLLLWGGVTFPVGGEGCRHEACYSSSGPCSHWERGRPQGPGMAVGRAELHAKFGLRPESMHTNIFLGRVSIALIRFSKIQNLERVSKAK